MVYIPLDFLPRASLAALPLLLFSPCISTMPSGPLDKANITFWIFWEKVCFPLCSNQNRTPLLQVLVSPSHRFRGRVHPPSVHIPSAPVWLQDNSPPLLQCPSSFELYAPTLCHPLPLLIAFCWYSLLPNVFFSTQVFPSSGGGPLKLYVDSLSNTPAHSFFPNSLHWPLTPSHFNQMQLNICHPWATFHLQNLKILYLKIYL